MAIKMSVKGVKKTMKSLDKYHATKEKAIENAIQQATYFVQGEIQKSIAGKRAEPKSVDTGTFLRSIHTQTIKGKSGVTSSVPYSKYLEFGTSKIPARRHFRNSIERNRKKIKAFVQKAIEKK